MTAVTSLARDVRQAWRALRAQTGFLIAAVATLAIGIGGTAAIFAIVHGVLLRPLPFADAGRLVAIGRALRDAPNRTQVVSTEELRDWQRESRSTSALFGWRDWGMARYVDTGTEPAFGIIVTPGAFDVLPVRPVLGRVFTADDDRPGSNRVVLLAYQYWRDRFGSDPNVLGRTLRLERGPVDDYTIVGVLPAAFTGLPSFDGVAVVLPASIDPDAATGRDRRNRQVFGRLRDSVSLAAARTEMNVMAVRVADAQHDPGNISISVTPLVDHEVGPQADSLRSFFAAVGFVFLIACANIAALQLARALARRREFSIRQALGDTRFGLTRSLIVESVLIALIAGLAGLVLSQWLVRLVIVSGPPIPRSDGVGVNGTVFAFAAIVSVLSGLLLGIPATLLTTRLDLTRAFKEESGHVANAPALRARMAFVGAQIALALMLAGGAVMAADSLVRQLSLKPGFDTRGVAYTFISPPQKKYETSAATTALFTRLVDEARAVPGVESAAATSAPPLSSQGEEPIDFRVIDPGGVENAAQFAANYFNVTPGLFATLGQSLLRGRDFNASDTATSMPVAIVNETFARRFLPGDAIGARIRLTRSGDVLTIVGIAGDVLRELQSSVTPAVEIYWPYTQRPRGATTLVLRASNPAAAMAALTSRVRAFDPDVRVGAPRLMSDRIARSFRGPRFLLLLFALFAAVALLLSGIGVYGLVSYTFAQRTREIGIRVSLGASPPQILRLIARSGFASVLAGSVIGCVGLVLLSRPLAAALPELGPVRPLALGVAWALLVAIGCAACYLPARRAARLDPVRAIRNE
jgi:putative ABC transport system permease protein